MTDRERELYETKYKPAYAALMKVYPFTPDDLGGEQWKDVVGYEGLYQVSTFGRVKSFKQNKTRILNPEICRNGYLRIDLRKYGAHKHFLIHRLVAETFLQNHTNKIQINHRDGCKLNNFIGNLEWATAAENIHHAVEKGLHSSGEFCTNARFTAEQIRFIRDGCKQLTQKQVAAMFNVNPATINEIRLGKTYRNAGGTIRPPESRRIADDIRDQIRAEYKKGVRGHGYSSLAKKFGFGYFTIWLIVHEK